MDSIGSSGPKPQTSAPGLAILHLVTAGSRFPDSGQMTITRRMESSGHRRILRSESKRVDGWLSVRDISSAPIMTTQGNCGYLVTVRTGSHSRSLESATRSMKLVLPTGCSLLYPAVASTSPPQTVKLGPPARLVSILLSTRWPMATGDMCLPDHGKF